MFGILLTFITTMLKTVGSVLESHENNINKKVYKHSDGLTYTDNKGRARLSKNNHIALYRTNYSNGKKDWILEDVETHEIIKNFTKEKEIIIISNKKEEAIKNNKSTFLIDENNHIKSFGFQGKRFQDLKTNEIYVVRKFGRVYYYMNIKNGFIVRKTDYSQNNNHEDSINISEFNKKQAQQMFTYNWNSCLVDEYFS